MATEENQQYCVPRELLNHFDPNNPQLRATNQTQQTPLMQRPIVMATKQVNRVQPPPAPIAVVNPAAATNQNPVAETRGAVSVTQEQENVSSSQQFIPPGIYTSLQIDDDVSTYH